MHHRSKSSHYTPTAQDRELRRQASLGDHLCAQIDVWRKKHGLPAAVLRTNSRDLRQRIQDEVDRQFEPLRKSIAKTISDLAHTLRTQRAAIDPVIKAMTAPVADGNSVIVSLAAFSRDSDARRARADAYPRAVTNASSIDADPAVKAMTEFTGDDVVVNLLRRGK